MHIYIYTHCIMVYIYTYNNNISEDTKGIIDYRSIYR